MRGFLITGFVLIATVSIAAQEQTPTPTPQKPAPPAETPIPPEKRAPPVETPFPSQQPTSPAETPKKANARPADAPTAQPDPFDGATVEKMRDQCVTLDTEAGAIEIELMPEVAPESVRNFLNLAATGSLDTTTFSRVVKDFVIQGGNLTTSEKWGVELQKRASRRLPDEPGVVKHVRGIVSMARGEEANSASTHFFILVGEGQHLNGKFAAFGRVRKGMEVADAINAAPKDGDKPEKPVRITRAKVSPCPAEATK